MRKTCTGRGCIVKQITADLFCGIILGETKFFGRWALRICFQNNVLRNWFCALRDCFVCCGIVFGRDGFVLWNWFCALRN